jgi:hypothetical protein
VRRGLKLISPGGQPPRAARCERMSARTRWSTPAGT